MFGKKKIDFLVIGAQKSGTTSLYEYITAHLLVDSAKKKEVHFFDNNFDKGTNWYHNRFWWNKGLLQGEATPYYLFDKKSPERVKGYNPKIKLITVLREPAERAFSQYRMNIERGDEPLDFMDTLLQEEERIQQGNASLNTYSYQNRGLYFSQLQQWEEHFDRSQILVLNYHDFFKNPWNEVQKVYEFLDLPAYFGCTQNFFANRNSENTSMPEEARNHLRHYFAEPNKRLAEQYGIYF